MRTEHLYRIWNRITQIQEYIEASRLSVSELFRIYSWVRFIQSKFLSNNFQKIGTNLANLWVQPAIFRMKGSPPYFGKNIMIFCKQYKLKLIS